MKKTIIIVSIVILVGILLYGVYNLYFKRTPEKILKLTFDISLKGFDYKVESFDEEWCPNGDGHLLLTLKFNNLTQENIDYLKKLNAQSLPVSELEQISSNAVPKQFLEANKGYYLYQPEKFINLEEMGSGLSGKVATDFKIFIIDTDKKTAVLYYQYM